MRIHLFCLCLFCSVSAHAYAFSLESIAKALCFTTGGYLAGSSYSWYMYQEAVTNFSVAESLARNSAYNPALLSELKNHVLENHREYCKQYTFITPPYAHYPFLRYKSELDSAIIWLSFARFFYFLTEYGQDIKDFQDRLYYLRDIITQCYEYIHEQRDYELHTTIEEIKCKVNQNENHS